MRSVARWVSVCAIGVFVLVANNVQAASLTVAWDPVQTADIAGYVVSYGLQSGVYTNVVNVGSQTSQAVSGLADNTTYYFVVQAYDTSNRLSAYSAEAVANTSGAATPGTAATFIGSDATTQGSWKGKYGKDGYAIAADSSSLPLYANLTPPSGMWVWASSTSDIRALQKANTTDRQAATWYASAFSVDVNLTDGNLHQVTAYAIDWDTTSRVETLEVRDATTDALLDTRALGGFYNGQYVTWQIRGHVKLRFIMTSGANAVVSGVFFDPVPTTLNPPATGVPSGPAPADGLVGVFPNVALSWNASANATQYDVAFGTSNPPPVVASRQTQTTYQPLAPLSRGTTYYWQVAATGPGGTVAGPVWSFTTQIDAPAAVFVGTDLTTQGNWKGQYGRDGYVIAADAVSLPGYAEVAQTTPLASVWSSSTTDVRALQKAAGTDRQAAAWYGGSFSIDVNFTDGQAHDVALYALDWDTQGRVETIQLIDPSTGAILDGRTLTAFSTGQYWVWNVRGHVIISATAGAVNAVVSGVFFDSLGGPVNLPPAAALTSPASGATYTAPASVSLSAAANDTDGSVSRVDFYAGANVIGTLTAPPYNATWTNVPAGSYSLVAVATDNLGATTASAPVLITVNAPKPPQTSATFVGTDTTTRGTWKGVYGAGGFTLANDGTSLPSYATVSQQGMLSWTYSTTTTDVSALQRATQPGRIAADWYGDTFAIDVNIVDGVKHQISLYLLDWDSNKRRQTIDVIDAATGTVLDSRNASKFQNGQYWIWTVTGHVVIRVTRTAGASAVVSGLFFDR